MRLYKNQKGFGLVEGLLIVIALTLIAGVGYYVYSSRKDNSSKTNEQITSQPAAEAKQQDEYFEFKELGVKIPLSKELAGLDSQTESNYLYLTTDAITASKNRCDPNNTFNDVSSKSFASLSRQTGIYPKNPGIDDGSLLKQFDGFYITASYPNGYGCADNASGSQLNDYTDKVMSAQKALGQAFKSAEEIQ
jgi:Tfp pilus assembly protein PilX